MKQVLCLLTLSLLSTACGRQAMGPANVDDPHIQSLMDYPMPARTALGTYDLNSISALSYSLSGGYPRPAGSCFQTSVDLKIDAQFQTVAFTTHNSCGSTCSGHLAQDDIQSLQKNLAEAKIGVDLQDIHPVDNGDAYLSVYSLDGGKDDILFSGSENGYGKKAIFGEPLRAQLGNLLLNQCEYQ